MQNSASGPPRWWGSPAGADRGCLRWRLAVSAVDMGSSPYGATDLYLLVPGDRSGSRTAPLTSDITISLLSRNSALRMRPTRELDSSFGRPLPGLEAVGDLTANDWFETAQGPRQRRALHLHGSSVTIGRGRHHRARDHPGVPLSGEGSPLRDAAHPDSDSGPVRRSFCDVPGRRHSVAAPLFEEES
jgi:hypothetical protein